MLILEVSSVHETHKHASLNDSFAFSHFKRTGQCCFCPEISIVSQGGKASWLPGNRRRGSIQAPRRDIDGVMQPSNWLGCFRQSTYQF